MREVRVSPDNDAVAIRTDSPEDAWDAWGVMRATGPGRGGHWAESKEVEGWEVK
jgi:hypothetical protein